jgi:hypothetical protein
MAAHPSAAARRAGDYVAYRKPGQADAPPVCGGALPVRPVKNAFFFQNSIDKNIILSYTYRDKMVICMVKVVS